MIKSIIIVSIIVSTHSISLKCYAQEPVEAKLVSTGNAAESTRSDQSSAVVTAGNQETAKMPNRGTTEVPLANLFPIRDSTARNTVNAVVPSATPLRHESPVLQHEIHGEFTTIFNSTNFAHP